MSGPLGDLPGMTYDPTKKRYFKSLPVTSTSSDGRETRQKSSITQPRETNSRWKDAREQRKMARANGNLITVSETPATRAKGLKNGKTEKHRTVLMLPGYQQTKSDPKRLPSTSDHARDWRIRSQQSCKLARTFTWYTSPLSEWERSVHTDVVGDITSLATVPGQDDMLLAGTSLGTVISITQDIVEYDEPRDVNNPDYRPMSLDNQGNDNARDPLSWARARINRVKTLLGSPDRPAQSSKIVGVHAGSDHYVAPSFGPKPTILHGYCKDYWAYQHNHHPEHHRATLPTNLADSIESCHNLGTCFSSAYSHGAMVLGGNGGNMVYLKDSRYIAGRQVRVELPVKSDILASEMLNMNEAVLGTRYGSIFHYDFRIPKKSAACLRYHHDQTGILRLKQVDKHFGNGRGILAMAMKSQLSLIDLRFVTNAPTVVYQGHETGYDNSLAMTTNPEQSILFAASADRRINGYNIMTGEKLVVFKDPNHLFNVQFGHPVAAIEVSQDGLVHVGDECRMRTYGRACVAEPV